MQRGELWLPQVIPHAFFLATGTHTQASVWRAQSREVALQTTQSQAVSTPCHRRVQVLEVQVGSRDHKGNSQKRNPLRVITYKGSALVQEIPELQVVTGLEIIWENITLSLIHFHASSQALHC